MSTNNHTATTRRTAIISATLDGDVSVDELSQRFNVSSSTIRRDLQRLQDEGKIARTYGGATRSRSSGEVDAETKHHRYPREKRAIARHAATFIEPGDVCLFDAGTTIGRLAMEMRGVHPLTVVTPGINSLMALHDDEGIELIVTGGQLRHTNQGLLGPIAERCFETITGDKVFLGAEALDPDRGISCPTLAQASLKSLMAGSGRQVFVLADGSKLTGSVFPYWAQLPANTRLVTTDAPDWFVESFKRAGGEVDIVAVDEPAEAVAM